MRARTRARGIHQCHRGQGRQFAQVFLFGSVLKWYVSCNPASFCNLDGSMATQKLVTIYSVSFFYNWTSVLVQIQRACTSDNSDCFCQHVASHFFFWLNGACSLWTMKVWFLRRGEVCLDLVIVSTTSTTQLDWYHYVIIMYVPKMCENILFAQLDNSYRLLLCSTSLCAANSYSSVLIMHTRCVADHSY